MATNVVIHAKNAAVGLKSAFHGSNMADKPVSIKKTKQMKIAITSESEQPSKKVENIARRQLITLGASAAISAACSCCLPKSAKAEDWSYGVMSGPPSWGGVCSVGQKQSPIDLPRETQGLGKSELGILEFQYLPVNPSFLNTGHGTMQVRLIADIYSDLYFHFSV